MYLSNPMHGAPGSRGRSRTQGFCSPESHCLRAERGAVALTSAKQHGTCGHGAHGTRGHTARTGTGHTAHAGMAHTVGTAHTALAAHGGHGTHGTRGHGTHGGHSTHGTRSTRRAQHTRRAWHTWHTQHTAGTQHGAHTAGAHWCHRCCSQPPCCLLSPRPPPGSTFKTLPAPSRPLSVAKLVSLKGPGLVCFWTSLWDMGDGTCHQGGALGAQNG